MAYSSSASRASVACGLGAAPLGAFLLQRVDAVGQQPGTLVDVPDQGVLGAARLVQGIDGLPGRGGERSEGVQQARILGVELAARRMDQHPDGAGRLVVHGPGRQQAFLDRRFDAAQGREAAFGAVEQDDMVAFQHSAARAGVTRHGAVHVGRKAAGGGVPAEHALRAAGFEDADAGRIGMAQLDQEFGQLLQHAARIGGHLAGERGQRLAFGAFVAVAHGTACQFIGDQDLIDG
jgi:hypothetical protein